MIYKQNYQMQLHSLSFPHDEVRDIFSLFQRDDFCFGDFLEKTLSDYPFYINNRFFMPLRDIVRIVNFLYTVENKDTILVIPGGDCFIAFVLSKIFKNVFVTESSPSFMTKAMDNVKKYNVSNIFLTSNISLSETLFNVVCCIQPNIHKLWLSYVDKNGFMVHLVHKENFLTCYSISALREKEDILFHSVM